MRSTEIVLTQIQKELAEGREPRVLFIGSNAGDRVGETAEKCRKFFAERGLERVSVQFVRDADRIRGAIKGDAIKGVGRASIVIVGQEARQYDTSGGMTISVDPWLIGDIRSVCNQENVPLRRFHANPDGSYTYYPDSPGSPVLPPEN